MSQRPVVGGDILSAGEPAGRPCPECASPESVDAQGTTPVPALSRRAFVRVAAAGVLTAGSGAGLIGNVCRAAEASARFAGNQPNLFHALSS